MINDNTLNFIRFSSGFNNLKKEELEAFAENEIFELNEYNASEEIQRKHFYTLLKNNDGPQGVAQEDGKYIHTAWAYNSDGTDGFTTVYPNLNLLNNTRITQENLTPKNWSAGVGSSLSVGSNNGIKVVNNGGAIGSQGGFAYGPTINVKAGDTITVSCFVTNIGTVPIKNFSLSMAFYGTSNSYPSKGNFVIPNDGKPYFFSFTVIVPSSATTARPRWFDVATAVNEKHIFEVYKMKLEQGSIATPWMPSASEVTTADWPSYMGQYTDYTLEDSINPSSYTWIKIQGKYFYTLEDVNTNGTLKSYIIECLKLSLQTRWGNNLEYHIDRKTKYLNKLTGMQA